MHSPEFIKLIDEASSTIGVQVEHFLGNWAIKLSKNGHHRFIIGTTFPLNDAACYKIVRNKNLCSAILSSQHIPNVPHHVVLSPEILRQRRIGTGGNVAIHNFITDNGFPFLIKKNNSSKGAGVYLIPDQTELEDVLSRVYATEEAFCLSPLRRDIREFRTVILDGECLMCYEKIIPFVIGDGSTTLIELLGRFVAGNAHATKRIRKLFDPSLIPLLASVPEMGKRIPLQWKHNKTLGIKYEYVENFDAVALARKAASAVNARFVTVDIIHSAEFGFEVIEINASVGIHFIFSPIIPSLYLRTVEIFRSAIEKVFAASIH